MNDLVFQKKGEALTDSLRVAEVFEKRHDNVLANIKNLDCSKEFTALNFKVSEYKDLTGRVLPKYLMTKDGFTFLVMGYRGKKAAKFKEDYIKAFNKMESFIREKTSQEWLDARQHSKAVRHEETDTLKEFVEYAKAQGSTHAEKYYISFSRLANSMSGITDRDNATIGQLSSLSVMENIIRHKVSEEMQRGKPYRDIFQDCKTRMSVVREMAFIGEGVGA